MRERDNAELLALRAVADERCRIARDVHDAIAHSLSVMLLHLNGAQLLIDDDPDETREALDEAISEGRRSLDEVRHVVGLLGLSDEGAGVPAADSDSTLGRLVESYRRAGLDVALDMRVGASVATTPFGNRGAVWSAVYRIVQESLANAVRHAPGASARVNVAADAGVMHLRVTNGIVDSTQSTVGNGVAGMRERVRMLGGQFSCGAVAQHWVVECTLPLDAHASPTWQLTSSRR